MSASERARAASVAALAALLLAASASARPPELPPELEGRLELEIARCKPIGRADALLEADLVLRAGKRAVALPALSCAAYDDAGAPFYVTPVSGPVSLRARERLRLTVRFAADATHRECGCSVRDLGAVAREAESASPASDPEASTPAAHPASEAVSVDVAAGPTPPAPPALRFERVLAPHLTLRAAPSARAEVTGSVPAGARVAVDRIERGWKRARTAEGLSGWLPSDAATADIGAPERVGELLAPLHRANAGSAAPCASVERAALGELVAAWRVHERAVYVRPLWHALVPEDREAFRVWASTCYSVSRVIDAATGQELRPKDRREPR